MISKYKQIVASFSFGLIIGSAVVALLTGSDPITRIGTWLGIFGLGSVAFVVIKGRWK